MEDYLHFPLQLRGVQKVAFTRILEDTKHIFDMSSFLYNLFEVKVFVKINTSFQIKITLQYHTLKCLIKHSF
jgi:hypothetical protein